MPLYMLGFMGATRRLDHYDAATGWHPLFIVVAIGAFIILLGASIQFFGLFYSIYDRKNNLDRTGGDPWNGRSLEWSIPSPPPIYNFAVIPTVDSIDPLWAIKRSEAPEVEKRYEDIHLPKNTAMGLYLGLLSLIFGFAMVWHIWWLAVAGFVGIIACMIIRLSGEDEHMLISAAEVEQIEQSYARRQEAL
jgi:cytochrome o ubiquinol oxidase subunit 1